MDYACDNPRDLEIDGKFIKVIRVVIEKVVNVYYKKKEGVNVGTAFVMG